MLFNRQRADSFSQFCAMRANVMHRQHIKHCCYTADIRIRLHNPELSQAVPSRSSSAFGVSSISFICHPGPDIFQECILVPWFCLAAADPCGQQIAQAECLPALIRKFSRFITRCYVEWLCTYNEIKEAVACDAGYVRKCVNICPKNQRENNDLKGLG